MQTVTERLGLSGNSIGFSRDRCLERLGTLLEAKIAPQSGSEMFDVQ